MNFNHTIYPFKIKLLSGEERSLSAYSNKILLIVNIASGCGYTPQLQELQDLRTEFSEQGFEVLAFPSNDFGDQEPLEGEEISQFCEVNYGVQFPVSEKVKVKGEEAHPLFKFLSSKKLNGHFSSTPRWNFQKYLVDRNGEVVDYFYSFTKPSSSRVKKKIQQLL